MVIFLSGQLIPFKPTSFQSLLREISIELAGQYRFLI